MAACLTRMDEMNLIDVAAHMDFALARFDQRYPAAALNCVIGEEQQQRDRDKPATA